MNCDDSSPYIAPVWKSFYCKTQFYDFCDSQKQDLLIWLTINITSLDNIDNITK